MNIENNKDYKTLKALMNIVNILTMIEFYDESKPFSFQEFINSLRELEPYLEEGLIDFSKLSDRDKFLCYYMEKIQKLKKEIPEEIEKIDYVANCITLNQFVLLLSPSFVIKVMNFVLSRASNQDELVRHNLIIAVRNILRYIPYSRTADERIFLSKKYPNHFWYDAYFFENASVPQSEQSFLLEELLKTVLITELEDEKYDDSIRKHLKQEGCQISKPAFLSLFRCHTRFKNQCELALFAIQESETDIPVDPIKEIEQGIQLLNENKTNYLSNLTTLFDVLFMSFPTSDWLCYFVKQFYMLEKPANLEEHFLEYIKVKYPSCLFAYIEDEFIIGKKTLREEAEKKLIITLKNIQKGTEKL